MATIDDARFVALCQSLVAAGHLSDAGPMSGLNFTPPAKATPSWRVGPTDPARVAAQAALDAWDWTQTADQLGRRDALAQLSDKGALARLSRAVVVLLTQEINILRALHSLPARTAAQVQAALQNAINSGAAD